jgi:hypothetical protein
VWAARVAFAAMYGAWLSWLCTTRGLGTTNKERREKKAQGERVRQRQTRPDHTKPDETEPQKRRPHTIRSHHITPYSPPSHSLTHYHPRHHHQYRYPYHPQHHRTQLPAIHHSASVPLPSPSISPDRIRHLSNSSSNVRPTSAAVSFARVCLISCNAFTAVSARVPGATSGSSSMLCMVAKLLSSRPLRCLRTCTFAQLSGSSHAFRKSSRASHR